MSDETEFTLRGKRQMLSRKQVINAARAVGKNAAIRSHAIVIQGYLYPVKPIFARATGNDVLDFTTMYARNVLHRLGFELKRLD